VPLHVSYIHARSSARHVHTTKHTRYVQRTYVSMTKTQSSLEGFFAPVQTESTGIGQLCEGVAPPAQPAAAAAPPAEPASPVAETTTASRSSSAAERKNMLLNITGTKALLMAYGANSRCFNDSTMCELELLSQTVLHDMVKKAAICAAGRNSVSVTETDVYLGGDVFHQDLNPRMFNGMEGF